MGNMADPSDGLIAVAPTGDLMDRVISILGAIDQQRGFSSRLGWTHYRTLCSVENHAERLFYEIESERCNWSQPVLERQIHSHLFLRLMKSTDKAGVLELAQQGQARQRPMDVIKHPYVLDFLGLPEATQMHESRLEAVIVDKLQPFLLIGLKMGRMTQQDVGQMDRYVRMFDELRRSEGDNPTVGLILCAEGDEVVACYTVLNESQQLFASKYMLYLPSEDELRAEITRTRQALSLKRHKSTGSTSAY